MPGDCVENTLPGFLLALERGADAIELDVHVTGDGVVVVHHDDKVRGRAIAAARWGEIEGIDLGGGAPIPRLDQVLIAIGDRATVYVELVAPLIAAPSRYHWYFRVTGAGDQVPGAAVSLYPTLTVPVTFGTPIVMVPFAATDVAADVLSTVA